MYLLKIHVNEVISILSSKYQAFVTSRNVGYYYFTWFYCMQYFEAIYGAWYPGKYFFTGQIYD